MNEWKTYKLEELVTLQRGHDLTISDIVPGPYPVAGSNGIIGSHSEFTTKGPSLTIGRSGNSIGVAHYYEMDFWAHNTTLYAKEFKNSDPKFIYYLLKMTDFIGHNSGSAVPSLNRNYINPIEVVAPSIEIQKEIATILTSLDDKIELNLQMNQTLEAMAQAVFKDWFVNFNFPSFDGELVDGLPKGWKEWSLKDFGKIICGKTPSKAVEEYFGGEYMFLKIPDMHNSVFVIETSDTLTNEGLQSQSNKTLPPNSVCVSSIATVGLVCMNPVPCQTNQQINSIVPSEEFWKYYIFFLAKSMRETFAATASGGTATLNMNTSQFSNLKAIKPADDLLLHFDEVVSPMMERILANEYEIKSLTQIRDSLLPKLMTGKIEIQA